MGLLDLFKKSATTDEAFKLFNDVAQKCNHTGYPTVKTGTSFYVSPYNTLNSDVCSYDLKFVNKFKMSMTYRYSKKDKTFSLTVWFYDLAITDKIEQQALIKTFPDFKIGIMPSALTVNVLSKPCKTYEELSKYVTEARNAWNNSGFYELVKKEFNPTQK